MCGALAISPPSASKIAQEKSSRSLMLTECAVLCSRTPICSATDMNRLLKISSMHRVRLGAGAWPGRAGRDPGQQQVPPAGQRGPPARLDHGGGEVLGDERRPGRPLAGAQVRVAGAQPRAVGATATGRMTKPERDARAGSRLTAGPLRLLGWLAARRGRRGAGLRPACAEGRPSRASDRHGLDDDRLVRASGRRSAAVGRLEGRHHLGRWAERQPAGRCRCPRSAGGPGGCTLMPAVRRRRRPPVRPAPRPPARRPPGPAGRAGRRQSAPRRTAPASRSRRPGRCRTRTARRPAGGSAPWSCRARRRPRRRAGRPRRRRWPARTG